MECLNIQRNEIEKILENYVDVWDGDWDDDIKNNIYEACLLWVRVFYSPIEAFAMERTMANIKANAVDKKPYSDWVTLSSIPMRKDSLLLVFYKSRVPRGTRVSDLFKRARLQNPFLRIMETTETAETIRARMYMTHPCLALLYMVNALTHMIENCGAHVTGKSYKVWRMIRWLTHVEEQLGSFEDEINAFIPVEVDGFKLDDAKLPEAADDLQIPLFRRICQTYAYIPATGIEDPLEDLESEKKVAGLETEYMSDTMNAFEDLYERLHTIMKKNDALTRLWDTIFIPYMSRKNTGERHTYVQKFVRVQDNNCVRRKCLLTRYKRSVRREDGDYLDLKRDVHILFRPVLLSESKSDDHGGCKFTQNDVPLSFRLEDVPTPDVVTFSDTESEWSFDDGLYHAYDWETKLVHEFELEFNRMEHTVPPVFVVWENCLENSDFYQFEELASFCSNITILSRGQECVEYVKTRGLKEPQIIEGDFATWVDTHYDSYVLVVGEYPNRVVDGHVIVARNGIFNAYTMSQWLDICTTGSIDTINM